MCVQPQVTRRGMMVLKTLDSVLQSCEQGGRSAQLVNYTKNPIVTLVLAFYTLCQHSNSRSLIVVPLASPPTL